MSKITQSLAISSLYGQNSKIAKCLFIDVDQPTKWDFNLAKIAHLQWNANRVWKTDCFVLYGQHSKIAQCLFIDDEL